MTLTLSDGTPVSRFAYGTMQWGGRATEADARAMYDAARAAGITHFDTAVAYTGGRSEEILGRIAGPDRDESLHRDQVRLRRQRRARDADGPVGAQPAAGWGMDPSTCSTCTASTPRCRSRRPTRRWPNCKANGAFRHLGVSNYAAWQVMKAQAVAATFDLTIDAIQPMYNLVKRQAEVEILPMAADQGIAVFPYSPLGGRPADRQIFPRRRRPADRGRDVPRPLRARTGCTRAADELGRIAAELGTHPATLAVAWVAASPFAPARPSSRPASAEQLAPSLAALTFEMTPDLHARLSALSPAPPPATDRLEEA